MCRSNSADNLTTENVNAVLTTATMSAFTYTCSMTVEYGEYQFPLCNKSNNSSAMMGVTSGIIVLMLVDMGFFRNTVFPWVF